MGDTVFTPFPTAPPTHVPSQIHHHFFFHYYSHTHRAETIYWLIKWDQITSQGPYPWRFLSEQPLLSYNPSARGGALRTVQSLCTLVQAITLLGQDRIQQQIALWL